MKIRNNAARQIDFRLLEKSSEGMNPPVTKRFRFLPDGMEDGVPVDNSIEVTAKELKELEKIPLFEKCVKNGELVVLKSDKSVDKLLD